MTIAVLEDKLIPSPYIWLQRTENVFDVEHVTEVLCPIPTPHFQIFPASPGFLSPASEVSFESGSCSGATLNSGMR